MKITETLVDEAVLRELGERLARARLDRNLKQAELAAQAGISKRTLERLEAGEPAELVNLIRVCRALGLVERFEQLVPEPVPSPIAQLKLQGRERKRAASPRKRGNAPAGKWTWADKPEPPKP